MKLGEASDKASVMSRPYLDYAHVHLKTPKRQDAKVPVLIRRFIFTYMSRPRICLALSQRSAYVQVLCLENNVCFINTNFRDLSWG